MRQDTTGYHVTLNQRGRGNERLFWCSECFEQVPLTEDASESVAVDPGQFRHGGGEGYCVNCGVNTLHTIAGGDDWRKRMLENPRLDQYVGSPQLSERAHLEIAAKLVSATPNGSDIGERPAGVEHDVFVSIRTAPGEQPVEEEIAPGVKQVHHGDAEEILVAQITTPDADDAEGDALVDVLEVCGLRATRIEPMEGWGPSAAGVVPDDE